VTGKRWCASNPVLPLSHRAGETLQNQSGIGLGPPAHKSFRTTSLGAWRTERIRPFTLT